MAKTRKKNIFQESDIYFQFNEDWDIIQYDSHTYYKGFSGVGLKGVDFLGILQGEKLLLMEIKNFRLQQGRKREIPFKVLLEQPEILEKNIRSKIEDTIKGVNAIHAYFRRNWIFRLFESFLFKWERGPKKWLFWSKVHNLLQSPEQVMIIFWLDAPESTTDWKAKVEEKLQFHLQTIAGEIRVVDSQCPPFPESLKTLTLG